MFQKLTDFFKKNQVKNLFTIHQENPQKKGIYSLTHPILWPESEVTTFFDKPSLIGLTPEEQLSQKLASGRKVNSFGAALNNEEQKPSKSMKSKPDSFGESFNPR